MMKAIWAEDLNGLIGKHNSKMGLPWNLPYELAYFKEKTLGHSILMGRNTFDAMHRKKLEGRQTVVVSKNHIDDDSIIVLHDLNAIREYQENHEVYIIGGNQLLSQTFQWCDVIYRTIVEGEYVGDVYAPNIPKNFKLVKQVYHPITDKNEVPLIFETWYRM